MPPSHAEAPSIEDGALVYWQAFWTLNGGRMTFPGFGCVLDQPIPVSEMTGWVRGRIGFEEEVERDRFVAVMQAMDREYRRAVEEQRKKDHSKPAGSKAGG